ncbi:hypothetical protein HKX15_18605 [Sulfitobacter sp. KE37]|uniref:hypothetical protein n=1 Tax=unclassified Sulfitobacter TaxID=196795 RepID=UPI0023E201F8|nr:MULTISPECIES: hypothetical protein [unclassified Sulfitobacter]MDF3352152.1 hypothetical protein [Sulfitobacter sp. KE12]MDF3355815.1 hypothetical protein [Sulfitobacter sp. KE27]MDF3370483.1 hypothetical protein [Sulfitobacter sp. Ks43]MDF3374137.1 hypothetical protein [Sulfitobacter sp. KS8]MDF3377783.1 hypothetical protein [Sulfitobacter sp. KE37]
MPRHPAHSDAELSDTIRTLMAKTDAVPTYDAVRTALGGPVSNDRLQKALGNARLAQTAPPSVAPAVAAPPAADPQAIAREVAALVARPVNATAGYRAPAFAEIKAVVLRTLNALEQSCHQHDAVVAPYIERIGQLEAEAAARGA